VTSTRMQQLLAMWRSMSDQHKVAAAPCHTRCTYGIQQERKQVTGDESTSSVSERQKVWGSTASVGIHSVRIHCLWV
jgi:molybdenum cofactor biosynthesis enzyme MoaA